MQNQVGKGCCENRIRWEKGKDQTGQVKEGGHQVKTRLGSIRPRLGGVITNKGRG